MSLLSRSHWFWKIPLCGLVHVAGTELGDVLVRILDLEMMSVPHGVEPSFQGVQMLLGGMVIPLGLAAMALGLSGRQWLRWLILASSDLCRGWHWNRGCDSPREGSLGVVAPCTDHRLQSTFPVSAESKSMAFGRCCSWGCVYDLTVEDYPA